MKTHQRREVCFQQGAINEVSCLTVGSGLDDSISRLTQRKTKLRKLWKALADNVKAQMLNHAFDICRNFGSGCIESIVSRAMAIELCIIDERMRPTRFVIGFDGRESVNQTAPSIAELVYRRQNDHVANLLSKLYVGLCLIPLGADER